ncbi:MAG: hypothetical protein JSW39_19070 [Desulfobacterales bacterium]|nr:MAG: hypothetical protein JSW39_19070 [Desulfobacterales bacterium]
MFGSILLDVGAGLGFIYLLLSLLCSALNEWIVRIFAMRANTLRDGIKNLLEKEELAKVVYQHPLIKGFYRQGWFDRFLKRTGGPSYIASGTFARALWDIAVPEGNGQNPIDVEDLIRRVTANSNLPHDLKKSLQIFVREAQGDLQGILAEVEQWFDDTMARVSGWYKRKTQLILLVLALVVSAGLNVDTISIANSLFKDAALRDAIVAAARQALPEREIAAKTGAARVSEIRGELERLHLPIGWIKASDDTDDPREVPSSAAGWVGKIIGLLVTIFAVSLGAPFWFDLVNKIINLRGSGGERAATAGRDGNA